MQKPLFPVDITLKVDPFAAASAEGLSKRALAGHLGTHFDVMDKEFPPEYTELPGYFFDVRKVLDREIGIGDIDPDKVLPGMFIGFCSGFLEEAGYGTGRYHHAHPQLSKGLIDLLLDRRTAVIGIDFAGIRRGSEHTPMDQYCADRGTFIVENLCNLSAVAEMDGLTVCTYPVSWTGVTGLPCRIFVRN